MKSDGPWTGFCGMYRSSPAEKGGEEWDFRLGIMEPQNLTEEEMGVVR